ncbi:MAG: hypothetical protein SFX18_17260 [Pirellulales bacterium]|nr:hypothetical protein [Pirellulales bacterium]
MTLSPAADMLPPVPLMQREVPGRQWELISWLTLLVWPGSPPLRGRADTDPILRGCGKWLKSHLPAPQGYGAGALCAAMADIR